MHTFDESYFDAGLDRRGTRCEKWDGTEKESVLPLWVADMDFPSPPEVAEAIAVRALHPTYGYTLVLPDDTRALTGFWQRRHNLTIQDEWVMMIPCVVTGIRLALLALTKPGDGVMIQSPVYGPFRFSVEATERRLMGCAAQARRYGSLLYGFGCRGEAAASGRKGAGAVQSAQPGVPRVEAGGTASAD